ncbi:hypothetical protein [Novosphingobium terrae]|uniref:hypothetical protein n=1 Tax=Novosphingobium terrae TaxID=2726189 RepID=UPI00197D47A2|nr:hypothetical protein [Novosphingobium terrae]
MKRFTPPHRSMSLALCLMALSVTSGCAHFREGAERARGQDDTATRPEAQPEPAPAPEPAPVAPPQQPRRAEPAPTPPPPPAPAPAAPEPAPVTPAPTAEPAPAPAPDTSKADAAARKAEARDRKAQAAADAKAQRAQDKAARHAEKAAPEAPAPVREPIPDAAPVAAAPPPPPPAAPAEAAAPGSANAIVTFASTPGTHCGACETLKISVSPGGKVLIERGHFSGGSDWRYRRYTARVKPEQAAAFSARLTAYRPQGRQLAACTAPAGRDSGVVVEWFEMGRHDQLNVSFACNAQIAEAMRSAPDLLGLKQLDFPWKPSR